MNRAHLASAGSFLASHVHIGLALGLGIATVGLPQSRVFAQSCTLPPSPGAVVQHVVFVVLEDRSFDHLLGWLTGTQTQAYPVGDSQGQQWCTTFPLDSSNNPDCPLGSSSSGTPLTLPTTTGTDDSDPDHGLAQLATYADADGAGNLHMDGWLFSLNGALLNQSHLAIGYYDQSALPYLSWLVTSGGGGVLPNYFSSMVGQSHPNRMYEHAATTDRIDRGGCQFECPPGQNTIWDFDQGGLGTDFPNTPGHQGRYYYGGSNATPPLDYLNLFWPDRGYVSHRVEQFIDDLSAGIFAPVTFIDSQHFHVPDDVSGADLWLQGVVESVRNSSYASSTVIVITWEEGGGFFDHVVQPKVPSVTYADVLAGQQGGIGPDGNGKVPLGFRVPAIVVSPFGPGPGTGFQFDHTSVLKMIEWAFLNNWRIPPSGSRATHRDATDDSYVANLACALGFSQ